jgi:hypothetical protein
MNTEQLLEKLTIDPMDTFDEAINLNIATENSYYLYEIHQMGPFSWENHVWIFNDLTYFKDFLPIIIFNDLVINEDRTEFDDVDWSEDYELYHSLQSKKWDLLNVQDFLKKHGVCSQMKFIELGKVSDLLEVSDEEYEKCKESYSSLEELEKIEVSEGRYKILHAFHVAQVMEYSKAPSYNPSMFLEMLNCWES